MTKKSIHIYIEEEVKERYIKEIERIFPGVNNSSKFIATLLERELETKELSEKITESRKLLDDFRRKFDVKCTYEDVDKLLKEILKLNTK